MARATPRETGTAAGVLGMRRIRKQSGGLFSRRMRSSSACRSRVKGARKTVLWTVFSPERAEPRFRLPLRQTAGMVASLLRRAGLDWPVPDYSTLCRRQKSLAVQIPYRRADGPLNLLVDSTGIKFLG